MSRLSPGVCLWKSLYTQHGACNWLDCRGFGVAQLGQDKGILHTGKGDDGPAPLPVCLSLSGSHYARRISVRQRGNPQPLEM